MKVLTCSNKTSRRRKVSFNYGRISLRQVAKSRRRGRLRASEEGRKAVKVFGKLISMLCFFFSFFFYYVILNSFSKKLDHGL